jgi:hypothetical protein
MHAGLTLEILELIFYKKKKKTNNYQVLIILLQASFSIYISSVLVIECDNGKY